MLPADLQCVCCFLLPPNSHIRSQKNVAGLIDLNLHPFGGHDAITDRWVHLLLAVSPTSIGHSIDGQAAPDNNYAVFYHHDWANSDASTFWPNPSALQTALSGFDLSTTLVIGSVDSSDDDHASVRHFRAFACDRRRGVSLTYGRSV